ncbi:MAG TPA: hypothetical protein VMT35_00010 [Ignavibacteriaceae bacterium]|nr:hypothetical protein [Ignavibacteriaceae bacterium]
MTGAFKLLFYFLYFKILDLSFYDLRENSFNYFVMQKANKYKKYFSRLIFSAYLLYTVLNILHYHKIDLLPEDQLKTGNESSKSSPDLYYLDLNIVCKFQNTFTSIQTAVYFSDCAVLINNEPERFHFNHKLRSIYLNNFPENNPLRAPPSRSFLS